MFTRCVIAGGALGAVLSLGLAASGCGRNAEDHGEAPKVRANDSEEHERLHQKLNAAEQKAQSLPSEDRRRAEDTLKTEHELYHLQETNEGANQQQKKDEGGDRPKDD